MLLDTTKDRWWTAAALGSAAVGLGWGLQQSNGTLQPDALGALTVAFALTLLGVLLPRLGGLERHGERVTAVLLGAGLALQLGELLTRPPGIYLQVHGPQAYARFFTLLAVAAVVAGASLSRSRWLGPVLVPVVLVVHWQLGVWLLKASPNPFIDVFVFQRDASAALLAGQNPYAMTYPDIYGNSVFYGPGLSVNGRLTFGFPYPPLSLLLTLPGHVLAGDYRYAQLVATTLAAGLLAFARPGRHGLIAACVLLFTPRSYFVLEQGWTEPLVVLGLAAVVFCASRCPRALPFVFGLFLAVKQYLVFAAPLGLLLLPRPWKLRDLLRFGWKAGAVAAAVTLPLALWDFPAFWKDVVALQVHQPFRADALSYLAWWAQTRGEPPSTSLAFMAALVAVGLGLWRAPRTPAGFAASVSLAYLAFFAFNKQAFANYYYFVIGALCCAVAATQAPDGGRES